MVVPLFMVCCMDAPIALENECAVLRNAFEWGLFALLCIHASIMVEWNCEVLKFKLPKFCIGLKMINFVCLLISCVCACVCVCLREKFVAFSTAGSSELYLHGYRKLGDWSTFDSAFKKK